MPIGRSRASFAKKHPSLGVEKDRCLCAIKTSTSAASSGTLSREYPVFTSPPVVNHASLYQQRESSEFEITSATGRNTPKIRILSPPTMSSQAVRLARPLCCQRCACCIGAASRPDVAFRQLER